MDTSYITDDTWRAFTCQYPAAARCLLQEALRAELHHLRALRVEAFPSLMTRQEFRRLQELEAWEQSHQDAAWKYDVP